MSIEGIFTQSATPEESERNQAEIIEKAQAKRAAYNEMLEAATTITDVRKAIEEYAVANELDYDDQGPVVVNFMEGAYASQNKSDGPVPLKRIQEGLEHLEAHGARDLNEVTHHVFNYAAVTKLGQILGIAQEE